MAKYIVKRVLMALLTIFAIASLTFFLMKAIPGNPFLSEKNPPQSVLDALNEKYGLDKSIPEQYMIYMGNLLRGDLGESIKGSARGSAVRVYLRLLPGAARRLRLAGGVYHGHFPALLCGGDPAVTAAVRFGEALPHHF